MKFSVHFNFCLALVYFVVALAILPLRFCVSQETRANDWTFGYQAFNLLLQESNITICDKQEWLATPADEKFAIMIDLYANRDWAPVTNDVPALVMRLAGRGLNATFKPSLGLVDAGQSQDFYDSPDCPIVRPRSTHEVFLGVQTLVCNTPGYIARDPSQQPIADKQLYPATKAMPRQHRLSRIVIKPHNTSARQRFSILSEEPTKRIWVADPLLFSNQMIFKADNLRFADNALRWLSDDYRRKKVILLIGGSQQPAVDPSDLDIMTPIPTHEEVIESIKQIPLSGFPNVASAIAQANKDENIFNKIAHGYADRLKDGQLLRLIIFAILTCCVAFAITTYFWQRRILRRTASVTASRRRQNLSKREAGSEADERQAAASLLLNAFCLDVADRRLADWPEFPTPIVSQSSQDKRNKSKAVRATNEMADAYWRLRTKPKSYWTKQTLVDLEHETLKWRQLIADNEIMIQTEYV